MFLHPDRDAPNTLNYMKKTLLSILLAALLPNAFAGEIWVEGVSRESGWVDINKTKNNEKNAYNGHDYAGADKGTSGWFYNDYNNGDGFLCWAASAADILTWWHEQNPGAAKENPVAPSTKDDIWNAFRQNFYNDSGNPELGIEWYMNGTTTLANPTPKDSAKANGKYYTNLVVESVEHRIMDYDPRYNEWGQWDATAGLGGVDIWKLIAADMAEYLDNGYIITLGISGLNGGKHAVTLWGLEVDDDGYLTKMWITDSDDYLNGYGLNNDGLIELACTPTEDEMYLDTEQTIFYGLMTSYGITSEGTVYDDTEITNKQGRLWYEYNIDNKRQDYFYEYTAIKLPTMKLQGQAAPEPGAPALALLGLAGLCLRRRRR